MNAATYFGNEFSSWAIVCTSWFLTHQSSRYRGIFTWPASMLCAIIGITTLFVILFRAFSYDIAVIFIMQKLSIASLFLMLAYRIHEIRREGADMMAMAHMDVAAMGRMARRRD